jgi:hypothetical protein
MKRAVPILLFVLVLVFWQASPVFGVDDPQGRHSMLQESSLSHHPQRVGWSGTLNNDDPQENPELSEVFQVGEPLFMGNAVLGRVAISFHGLTNPLLIDRPPPAHAG